LLRANGTIFEESTNFEEARAQLYTALSTIAARQKLENVYDVILIDEVQDYSVDEITLIKQFGERLFAVGDNNQQISDHHGALAQLESLGVTKTPLTSHYRNGLKICRVADGIKNLIDHRDGLEATSNYDEARFPSRVEAIGDLSLEDQVTAAVPRIQTQLLAYPGEMIGIFCPRLEDLDTARAVFEESELSGEIHVQRSGAY
jgi:DNA helicase IV